MTDRNRTTDGVANIRRVALGKGTAGAGLPGGGLGKASPQGTEIGAASRAGLGDGRVAG